MGGTKDGILCKINGLRMQLGLPKSSDILLNEGRFLGYLHIFY